MITQDAVRIWDATSGNYTVADGVRVWDGSVSIGSGGGGGGDAQVGGASVRAFPNHSARLFPNASAIRQTFKP